MSRKTNNRETLSPARPTGGASGKFRSKATKPLGLAAAAICGLAVLTLVLSSCSTQAAPVASAKVVSSPAAAPTATLVPATSKPVGQAPALTSPGSQKAASDRPAVTAQDGVVSLPIADVSDGKAHFFTYQGADRIIHFFVLKSSDGVIRAAFDACDVCFPAKKGYRQEGDFMVCNNCGSRFPSVSINVVKGGCNPAPLERQVTGDSLVIQAADLEAGARYF